ncbi:MAG TPA: hypothetical protein VK841_18250 [Polyangiaceae bacterium]|jgi:hypothetical protein|nr:hypothetical protein [Polyangiaceae bacterium]
MIDVFVSAGRTSTSVQERFLDALEGFLRQNMLNPRLVGRNDFSSDQPLKHIDRVMGQCSGTVILAFERLFIEKGVELRGSSRATAIDGQRIPTVWNQIEAGMAYASKQPLLMIVEDGLRVDGLLEHGYEWYVLRVELDERTLQNREFLGTFADWKKKVEMRASAKKTEPTMGSDEAAKVPLSLILRSISASQAFALLSAMFAIVAAVACGAYWLAIHQPAAIVAH